MAEVFRAAVKGPEGFRRELVVKRILPELSARPRFTQMFVNEAKISALLAHPNIVQIFEFGEADGAYFIAMESVRGLTLREVLNKLGDQDRAMPVVAAAEITRETLIALDYAHNLRDSEGGRLDIVHRDVSPSNVMIAETGAVKVLDFGIARAADLVSDDEGKVVKGKIAYLAPEQITCGEIDARVDVFAMGCVLHELLTGRLMFRARNDLQTKLDLLAQVTPPPSAWNSNVPPALDQVVARATARDPRARYASAGDMLADVENYLAAFRSSSRAVLRLMRSLSPGTSADGETPIEAAPAVADAGQGASAGASAERATRVLAGGPAPGGGPWVPPPRLERTDAGTGTGTGTGMGPGPGAATQAGRLGGAGSAEHTRFTRGVWRRRLILGAAAGLGLAALAGVVTGGAALWSHVSRVSLERPAAARPSADRFVLMTFVSTPAGARIIDGSDRTVGTTPATLPVTPSQIVVSFRFELEGHLVATASAVPDADRTLNVVLVPAPRPPKAPGRKAHMLRRATPNPR